MAATNRNLTHEIVQGRFRQDLYYRLSVFPIDVPPLRERFEDIPELTAYFVGRSAERVHVRPPNIGRHQLEALRRYSWPGNIRELQNVVERAVILSRSGGPLQFDLTLPAGEPTVAPRSKRTETAEGYVTAREFRERERQNLLAALVGAGWRINGRGGAAREQADHAGVTNEDVRHSPPRFTVGGLTGKSHGLGPPRKASARTVRNR